MLIPPALPRDSALRHQAQALEAAFLSQMLAHAGFDRALEAQGGGAGGAQFASFLREAQAKAMVQAGGLGLSESLFRALSSAADRKGAGGTDAA